ncbi:hypothetical protein D3C80_1901460 [compost metagenome]
MNPERIFRHKGNQDQKEGQEKQQHFVRNQHVLQIRDRNNNRQADQKQSSQPSQPSQRKSELQIHPEKQDSRRRFANRI